MPNSSPSHSTSADKHPQTPTGRREAGAEGSMGRKAAWGGRQAGPEGRQGRKGAWGGSEPRAKASLGRKGSWGGRELGAEASLGRKGVCQHLGQKGGIFRGGS
jgi:hypothetical protein